MHRHGRLLPGFTLRPLNESAPAGLRLRVFYVLRKRKFRAGRLLSRKGTLDDKKTLGVGAETTRR